MSDGKKLAGQQYDPRGLGVLAFTEQVLDYSKDEIQLTGLEGTVGAEITPLDAAAAKTRVFDIAAITTALETNVTKASITIPRINFPNVLISVAITYNVGVGNGLDSHPAGQQGFTVYGSGSGSLSPSSSAQGSASILPDIQPNIVEVYAENVTATLVEFYKPSGTTISSILTFLTAQMGAPVTAWPVFRPVSHTITLKGQRKSISAKADTRVSGGGTTTDGQVGFEWGNGSSNEGDVTNTSKLISPTIHGVINFTGAASQSQGLSASAEASTPTFAPGSAGEQAGISNVKNVTASVTGSVSPVTLAATSPAAIPTSGLRLYSLSPGAFQYENIAFQAVIVDCSVFA